MRQSHGRSSLESITVLALSLAVLTVTLLAAPRASAIQSSPPKSKSLLQILAEWKYPGSTMRPGAAMADGGYPLVQSVKCHAVLITPDPIETVIAFYETKLGTRREAHGQNAPDVPKDASSVAVHDDSQGRSLVLRVIAVNTGDTSTTLVVSRGKDEKETHIAWLHYMVVGQRAQPGRG
jgi:hypothetical protein